MSMLFNRILKWEDVCVTVYRGIENAVDVARCPFFGTLRQRRHVYADVQLYDDTVHARDRFLASEYGIYTSGSLTIIIFSHHLHLDIILPKCSSEEWMSALFKATVRLLMSFSAWKSTSQSACLLSVSPNIFQECDQGRAMPPGSAAMTTGLMTSRRSLATSIGFKALGYIYFAQHPIILSFNNSLLNTRTKTRYNTYMSAALSQKHYAASHVSFELNRKSKTVMSF